MKKILAVFSMTELDDMLKKGNLAYSNHYSSYFDEVYFIYLYGKPCEFTSGNIHYISVGSPVRSLYKDLFLAPFRLYRECRKIKATHFMTACTIYGWLYPLLLKLFTKAKIVVCPVCLPHEIYATIGTTTSGYSRTVEKLFESLTFFVGDRIITGENLPAYRKWLENDRFARKKCKLLPLLVEGMPPLPFLEAAKKTTVPHPVTSPVRLLYVGRLNPDKGVMDLIEILDILVANGHKAVLDLCGDGPLRDALREAAQQKGLVEHIFFAGNVPNEELPSYHERAAFFVSPLTGSALREAALMGTTIVAYNKDFVAGLFEDEVTAFLAAPDDPKEMARKIMKGLANRELYNEVAHNAYVMAHSTWNTETARRSLEMTFGDL